MSRHRRNRRNRPWTALAVVPVTVLAWTASLLTATPAQAYDGTIALSISDAEVVEGDPGDETFLRFVVTATGSAGPFTTPLRVHFVTVDGTAKAPSTTVQHGDYVQTFGTAIIPAFHTTVEIAVDVIEDHIEEPTEQMSVRILPDSDGTVVDGIGVGTIIDDDAKHALSVTKTGTGSGTVTSDPVGIVCGASCSADFDADSSVQLTAAANQGSAFTGWSGACAGSNPTCTVTMDQARSVTATFGPTTQPQLTVAVTDLGVATVETEPMKKFGDGKVTSSPAGIDCNAYDPDGTGVPGLPGSDGDCNQFYDVGTEVTLTATPLTETEELGSPNHREPSFLGATSRFAGWGGACASAGRDLTCTVSMTAARHVTATFEPLRDISVIAAGRARQNGTSTPDYGNGTITSEPAGIDCNSLTNGNQLPWWFAQSPFTGDCIEGYDGGTVTLTATPTKVSEPFAPGFGGFYVTTEEDSVFDGWDGACASAGTNPVCTLTMDEAKSARAFFVPPSEKLSVVVTKGTRPSGTSPTPDRARGVVTSSPAGIDCGGPPSVPSTGEAFVCSANYSQDAEVVLTATPKPVVLGSNPTDLDGSEQSLFLGWGGACAAAGTATTCTVTMSQARNVTAEFGLDLIGSLRVAIGTESGPARLPDLDRRSAGRVTANVGGIDCRSIDPNVLGVPHSGKCQADLNRGSSVVLTAIPAPIRVRGFTGFWRDSSQLSTFSGWSGGGCTGNSPTCVVPVGDADTVTAQFNLAPKVYPLSVTVNSETSADGQRYAYGEVRSQPGPVVCVDNVETLLMPAVCSATYTEWTNVTLTAVPGKVRFRQITGFWGNTWDASTFAGWGGACAHRGTANTCTVTMSQARSVTAAFAMPYSDLTVTATGQTTTTNPNLTEQQTDRAVGTVTSNPAGISCRSAGTPNDCTERFPRSSATVTLTATPGPVVRTVSSLFPGTQVTELPVLSNFSGWSGACSGTAPTCTVTLEQSRSVGASFTIPSMSTLYVNVTGEDIRTTSGGFDVGGSTRVEAARGRVTSTPAGINCERPLFASMATQVCDKLYASSSNTVTLTATPLPVETYTEQFGQISDRATMPYSSVFTSWSGACTGSAPTCTVTLAQTRLVTANFAVPAFSDLTVTAKGQSKTTYPNMTSQTDTTDGSVTSSPAGINCRTTGFPNDCSERYLSSSATVTLTAVPGPVRRTTSSLGAGTTTIDLPGPSRFDGWSGACSGTALTCTVTLEQSRSVGASFSIPPMSTLFVNVTGTDFSTTDPSFDPIFGGSTRVEAARGRVTSSPAGINCERPLFASLAQACDKLYVSSSNTVTLTATALPAEAYTEKGGQISDRATLPYDSVFVGWSGACTGTALTCTVTLAQSREVTANFAVPRPQLTVSAFEQSSTSGTQRASGLVTSDPVGIACYSRDASDPAFAPAPACTEQYSWGTAVTLTAAPQRVRVKNQILNTWANGSATSVFAGWTGACAFRGTAPTCTVSMTQARTVGALFGLPGA